MAPQFSFAPCLVVPRINPGTQLSALNTGGGYGEDYGQYIGMAGGCLVGGAVSSPTVVLTAAGCVIFCSLPEKLS